MLLAMGILRMTLEKFTQFFVWSSLYFFVTRNFECVKEIWRNFLWSDYVRKYVELF